jgi:hypothetical protein
MHASVIQNLSLQIKGVAKKPGVAKFISSPYISSKISIFIVKDMKILKG